MGLLRYLKQYQSNESGQYAVLTGIFAVPLIVASSATIDYTSAKSEFRTVKDALDNAVLAAATNNGISTEDKRGFAKEHFRRNYQGRAEIDLSAEAQGDWVALEAQGLVPFSVSEAMGLEGISIKSRSKAKRSEENIICVLALAEEAENSIWFSGRLEFLAPNCAVHSNSTAPTALYSTSKNAIPMAKSFCATGGAKGPFSPYAKGECMPVLDPYIDLEPPIQTPCVTEAMFENDKKESESEESGDDGISDDEDTRDNTNTTTGLTGGIVDTAGALIEESENYTGDNAVFYPGTYCGGLTVDGRSVKFLPGDYLMLDGALTFKNGAEAVGDDVTFSFLGHKSRLKIESGSDVSIKAPSIGPRKGIAFMQVADTRDKINAKRYKQKEKKQKANVISGGGNLSVVGTVYFPTQALVVRGRGSRLGANTPAVSFIAHTIRMYGNQNSRVLVQVDHQAADLPPIKPRAEEAAILVE